MRHRMIGCEPICRARRSIGPFGKFRRAAWRRRVGAFTVRPELSRHVEGSGVGYICSDDYLVAVTCGRDRTVCNVLDITGPHPVRSSALGCAQFTVRDRKYSEEKKAPGEKPEASGPNYRDQLAPHRAE